MEKWKGLKMRAYFFKIKKADPQKDKGPVKIFGIAPSKLNEFEAFCDRFGWEILDSGPLPVRWYLKKGIKSSKFDLRIAPDLDELYYGTLSKYAN